MRFIAAAALAVLVLAGCKAPDDSDPNLATPPAAGGSAPAQPTKVAKPKSDTRVITYRVGGSADSADVTYSTASGQEQQQGASLPWTKSFKVKRDAFTMVDISAQNQGSGTVTCEIDVDGVKVKAAKSSGQYAVVSCDHSLGF
ncbi:MmpS family transport accessory protein [Actinoallomurus sp. CA-150999]|uniref:MmpS family transport accessory protein n=1 Tax=Actinoallomurus sp. CA-150999 TaxID=3239887 RepID=UPI003D936B9D